MSQQYHPPILRRPEDVVVDVQGFVTQVDDEDNPVKFAPVIQVLPHTHTHPFLATTRALEHENDNVTDSSPRYPTAVSYAHLYEFHKEK